MVQFLYEFGTCDPFLLGMRQHFFYITFEGKHQRKHLSEVANDMITGNSSSSCLCSKSMLPAGFLVPCLWVAWWEIKPTDPPARQQCEMLQ